MLRKDFRHLDNRDWLPALHSDGIRRYQLHSVYQCRIVGVCLGAIDPLRYRPALQEIVRRGDTGLGGKAKDCAEKNITMARDYLHKLSRAKDFLEAVPIHTEFMQSQLGFMGEQIKSLGEIYTKAATEALALIRKQLIPDVARCGGKSDAARLAPDCFVDFLLIANLQLAGRFSGKKKRITHFSARAAVLGLHLFPKANTPKPELG